MNEQEIRQYDNDYQDANPIYSNVIHKIENPMNDIINLEDIPQEIFVELFKYGTSVDFRSYGEPVSERDNTRAFNHIEILETGITATVFDMASQSLVEKDNLTKQRAFKIRGEFTNDAIIVKAIQDIKAIKVN